jgi:hypothetical protein
LIVDVFNSNVLPRIKLSLIVELGEVLVELRRPNLACGEMQDFIDIVMSERGRRIPLATADRWIAAAMNIEAAIPCGQAKANTFLGDRPPGSMPEKLIWTNEEIYQLQPPNDGGG